MKYLVNRETKEHQLATANWWFHGAMDYDEVEADSEGWIPWGGGECPLPDDCECEYRLVDGDSGVDSASNLYWSHDKPHVINITSYRPILTEQSVKADEWEGYIDAEEDGPQSVFTRLRTASEHAESIPSIIAEIDELLGPDYQVVRVEKVEATAPQEDMSDWRNWKPGDIVICVNGKGWENFIAGASYHVTAEHDSGRYIEHIFIGSHIADFRFHSRPTGATK